MKRSWIGAFVVALLVAGLSGCASAFVRAWTWNGPPSTEQKVKALAFDVVTIEAYARGQFDFLVDVRLS